MHGSPSSGRSARRLPAGGGPEPGLSPVFSVDMLILPPAGSSESKDHESFLGFHKSLAEWDLLDSFQDPLNSGTLNSGHKIPVG